ncbi:hypothetical protein MLD38_006033 [Melastoma candidum]|uniref:Uncharacterized protein n=1 Tax=Melastoma candidum TaxID=119954 RepID=A0ACB9RLL7_9MYRT|nr:hypothetical protein MLD38_006033 [Melastoma candidum]
MTLVSINVLSSSLDDECTRKGEVSDLKLQLRQLAGNGAPGVDDSKKDLFKKVIDAYINGDVLSYIGHCSEEDVLSLCRELC